MTNRLKANDGGASNEAGRPTPREACDVESMDALRAELSATGGTRERLAESVVAIENLANRRIDWSPNFRAAVERATLEAFDKLIAVILSQDGLLGALHVVRELAVAMSAPHAADSAGKVSPLEAAS